MAMSKTNKSTNDRKTTNTDNTEGPSDVGPPTGREPGRVALASLNNDLTVDGTDNFIDPEMAKKEMAARKELMSDGT